MASTIANVALVSKAGYDPGNPMFLHIVELDLKADYDAAGLLNFKTLIKTALGVGRTVLAVFPVNAKGLLCRYDAVADTLFFLWGNYAGANGPLIDVPTGNMAAYTDLQLGVISQ